MSIRSYICFFLILGIWLFPIFSNGQNDLSEVSDSVSSIDTLSNETPIVHDSLRIISRADSMLPFRSEDVKRLSSYFSYVEDQFPSPIIGYINGSPKSGGDYIPRKEQREDWKFYLAFFLLSFLALVRYAYSKEFEEMISVFKNWGPSQQMYRELGTGVSFGTVLLNIFSAMVLSFYIFLILEHFGFILMKDGWIVLLASAAAMGIFLMFRYMMLTVASMLLPFKKEINLFNFYEIQINRLLGVVLFPLILVIAFSISPFNYYALVISFIALIALMIIRYVKGFNIGVNYFGRHFFHFLLYICALEIAPILIIVRLLQNLGSLRFSL